MLYGNNQDANSVRANVQLVTRVRPLQLTDHVVQSPYFQVDPTQGSIVLGGNRLFQFDYVLPFDCPQHVIYKSYIEPSVNACFEGYNISIIAHGQTGAGKTFTIFGPGLLYTMNEADFGMLPRTVRQIFFKTKEYPDRQFSIQASYLEIYDEEIRDLLSVDPFPGEIIVQEDAQTGETLFIGATRMECQTIDDVFSCLETGLALRHTGPMMLNQVSGRSHGIFTIYIQQAWTQDGCLYEVRSKLQFFDLAGSDRLNEAAIPVNSGLLALNNVIAALGDPRRKASHIPYWDSKLTTILKESLGGNAFSILIVCLSPSASDLDETANTLNLATRAANISNRPSPNIRVTPLVALNALNLNPNIFLPISAPAGPAASAPSIDENQKEEDCSEDELFKLRFAASQWQQLVTNAESILCELDSSGALEKETKNRIQSWLCLKEEYANCIDPEIYAMKPRPAKQEDVHQMASNLSSLHRPNLYKRKNHHSSDTESNILHVIEEVSEPTPTHELSSMLSGQDDSSSMSDSSDSSDFTEQLDVLRQQFRETTDRLINSIETAYDTLLAQEWRGKEEALSSEDGQEDSSSPPPSTTKRRASVFGQANSFDPKVLLGNEESEPDDELFQEMRRLSETSDSRRLQVWQTNEQLKKAQQTLKELKQAIKIKEESIDVNDLPSSRRGDDNSPRKVDELERSLNTMKEEQLLLKEKLRREDEKKRQLQQELIDDQKRIAELERQLRKKRRSNRRGSLQGMNLDSLCEKEGKPSELEHKWRWLVAEEERLIELRTEIESRSEQLDERQRREETDGVNRSTESSKVIQPVVQEASPPSGASGDIVDKEAVRKEIRNMRHTRDALVLQRQALDEQQQRGRELDPVEERRMLELDEAIEAVDAAMEYKNELICSRYFELKSTSDDGLLTRLMSLSHPETRSLLCKYFQKVIDLREGSKKMEQQFAELEAQYEDQCRYIRKLSSALKHTQLEVGRRSAASASQQRHHYEHKISTAIKQLNDESSTGVGAAAAAPADADSRENRDLRRHLRQLLSVSNAKHQRTPGSADPVPSTAGSSRTPSLLGLHAVQALHEKITGLHRLKGRQTGPATTTTVTRERNKLIIKQQPVKSEETSTKRRH